MFEFINSYGALMYIAFIKVPLGARTTLFPGWFGQGMHGAAEMPYSCSIGKIQQPCLMEISQQLFSIFAVKMLSKNFNTVVQPYFKQVGVEADSLAGLSLHNRALHPLTHIAFTRECLH